MPIMLLRNIKLYISNLLLFLQLIDYKYFKNLKQHYPPNKQHFLNEQETQEQHNIILALHADCRIGIFRRLTNKPPNSLRF